MSIYAIGDIQGCFVALQRLLDKIQFNPMRDCLWFAGDLVNRGPQSLDVLRFVKSLGSQQVTVLGNHDLHLLAVAFGVCELTSSDTFGDILTAPDCLDLIDWLRYQPLLHYEIIQYTEHDPEEYLMSHAGVAPQWSLETAVSLAQEIASSLQGPAPEKLLAHLYGNEPSQWEPTLTGIARGRCITNYLTRMRYCYADGRLAFHYIGNPQEAPADLVPWFEVKRQLLESKRLHRHCDKMNILFGHWAALKGQTTLPNYYALDTGCIWGHCLTALRLEDKKRFTVACHSK